MARPALHIVDVFAEEQYAGNPLAVVLGAGTFDTATMQRFARETNFSETTFLLGDEPRAGGWDVRIFTPFAEVPFAGHPTLGTAWVIRQERLGGAGARVVLHLGVGAVPVDFRSAADGGREVLWMRQPPPSFGAVRSRDEIAPALGLSSEELDERFPCQEVSTGLPFLLVPLKTLAAVRRCRPQREAYERLVAGRQAQGLFVFAPEAHDPRNQIHARMFAELLGVAEDPATGSANGCLAAWIVEHRYFGQAAVSAQVEQGYEIGRPSLLRLEAAAEASGIRVSVGGRVFPVARGELL
ncbi:MAG TPA: PhzF family phenazine biosynthesis protein [Candidatus Polarisedimenticolaceae bacterium]|nr:PhzF family phenazine biosynthesis protein [Candidatus Polarisedimenticolaceae bacterium]